MPLVDTNFFGGIGIIFLFYINSYSDKFPIINRNLFISGQQKS